MLRATFLASMAFVGLYSVFDFFTTSPDLALQAADVKVGTAMEQKANNLQLQTPHPVTGPTQEGIRLHHPTQTRSDQAGVVQHPNPVIPKIVHMVWFYPEETAFRFHHLLCLISVQKHIGPTKILFWYNNRPTGPWWVFVKQTVPHLLTIQAEPPKEVFGTAIKSPEHQSDVFRIKVLQKYGGIYLDLDVIALKSFDSLLRYDVTMGAETPDLLANGIILSTPNSTFLHLWHEAYRTFDDSKWNLHSVILPMKLAKQHPKLVHIEWFNLFRPNWGERHWLYEDGKLWDWSENLAVHLYYREHNVEYDPNTIRALNTTAGEIFRFIYYGSPKVLPSHA